MIIDHHHHRAGYYISITMGLIIIMHGDQEARMAEGDLLEGLQLWNMPSLPLMTVVRKKLRSAADQPTRRRKVRREGQEPLRAQILLWLFILVPPSSDRLRLRLVVSSLPKATFVEDTFPFRMGLGIALFSHSDPDADWLGLGS